MSDAIGADEFLHGSNTQEQTPAEKVKIGDKEYDIKEVESWRQGNLRQEDYTKKTQELAEQRRATQQQLQEYENIKGMIGQIQGIDPSFIPRAQQLLTGHYQPPDPYADDPYMKEIKQQEQYIKNLWGWQQQTAQKQEELLLERELNDLQNKFPQMDRTKVIASLIANGDLDLEQAAKASHEEMIARVNSQIQNLAQQKQNQRRGIVEGGGGGSSGVLRQRELLTREDVEKATMDYLNNI